MLKVISVIEILQGFVAVVLIFMVSLGKVFPDHKIIVITMLVVLGAVSFYAGIKLWNKTKAGLILSFLFQLAQTIKIEVGDIQFGVSLGVEALFSVVKRSEYLIEINLVSLILACILLYYWLGKPNRVAGSL